MGKEVRLRFLPLAVALVLPLFLWCKGVAAGDENYSFHLGGYARTWASFNLHDQPETEGYQDRYKLSMLRGSLLLDLDARTGPFTWKVIARGEQEARTDYLTRLQEDVYSGHNQFGILDSKDTMDFMSGHHYNYGEIREAYVEFEPIKRLKLRLGRQQVVWGETDFFRAMDIVHGWEYRWRFFLEPENEEVRKPLILANVMIQVPELNNGSLQFIFRPGPLNRAGWQHNEYPLDGGRWSPQPYKGLNTASIGKYDFDHPDGDMDDDTWGVRWSGIAGPINYSLAYLKTFNFEPMCQSSITEHAYMPHKTGLKYWPTNVTDGLAADLIYPKIELVGGTVSGYVPWLDAVLSAEISYTFDEAHNVGSRFDAGPPLLGKLVAEGLFAWMEKGAPASDGMDGHIAGYPLLLDETPLKWLVSHLINSVPTNGNTTL